MNDKPEALLDQNPAVCGRYISYLYRRSSSYFTAKLRELELSSSQSVVMVGIYRYEGLNQCALAETISMGTGVVSRTLRELEDKNYIYKERDEKNRRNYNLFLTDAGRQAALKSLAIQGDYWNRLLKSCSEGQISAMNETLKQLELSAYALSNE